MKKIEPESGATDVGDGMEGRLQALSQRTARIWSWQIDVPSRQWRSTRPIALFRSGEAITGPYHVKKVTALFGRRQSRELLRLIDRSASTGEGFSCEVMDHSGPEVRYFAIDAEVESEADGTVSSIFGITRDVTRQRAAELQVIEARKLLERSQLVGRMGHWRMNLDGKRQYWSPALYQLCKLTPADHMPGNQFEQMIISDHRERVIGVVTEAVLARRPFSYFCDIEIRDRSIRTIETIGEPEHDDAGVCIGYFGITRDVTDLHLTSRRLARQTRLLERAQTLGQMGHWSIDSRTGALIWSPALYDMFGVDPGQPIDVDMFIQMVVPEDREKLRGLRKEALADYVRIEYAAEMRTMDGRQIFIETSGEAVIDDNGRFEGYFGVTRDITFIRRAERALEERNLALEQAQKVGRIGHWRLDLLTNQMTPSSMTLDILHIPRGTVVQPRYMLDRIVPDQKAEIERMRADAVSNGREYRYEADVLTEDGLPLVVQVTGEPVFSADGDLIAYFGTTQDVTDRVLAERSSHEYEGRLRTIFDAMDEAGIGIGVQDNEGVIEVARPALLRIAGFDDQTDVVGKRWSSLQGTGGTDIRNSFGDALAQAVAGHYEQVPNFELEWARPDGQRLSVLVRLAPLPGGARAMIVLDQTEQKEARREIEAREFRTRAILDAIDAAGIGYCVEDIEGRIFDVSTALRGMLRLASGADVLGRKWTELLNLPDHIRRRIDKENSTYNSGDGSAFVYPEFILTLPGGHEAQLHARSTPLPGIGRLVLVIDQTERWRLELQQAEMEQHMQQVQKMEAVGQLAGGVAHEINNMLHPIRTFTRAASRADDISERERLLQRVIDCADKAATIIRETLNFARGDEGEVRVRDINDLLSGVVAFSRDLTMRGVELEIELPEHRLAATVNETEFTQVMVNLLQNAADAMDDVGVIRIALDDTEVRANNVKGLEPGNYMTIVVSDSGQGMSPDVVDRVFEPFFTTKDPGKGTGLGLSVVYGIVKRWRGDINLISSPGNGTRVELLLPCANAG